MITIENKKTKLKKNEKEFLDYADLCETCIKTVDPQKGMDIEEMEKKLRVLKVLKNKDENIKLEDADFTTLFICIKNFKWGIISEDILNFYNYIKKLNETNN